jgi:O-antigen/teichoic acid export membrane protein
LAESLKNKAVKGVVWSAADTFSSRAVSFVVVIIMARLLTPQDYGLIGLLAVFLGISSSLIDCGFSQALIRKPSRTEVDNSTVFFFNIVVAVFMYIILFTTAPFIARFYNQPQLVPIVRVMALGQIVEAFAGVHRALFKANLQFRTITVISVISAIGSGIVGILMAYLHFGPWAIVAQQIVLSVFRTALVWTFSKWRPIWVFSIQSFKEFFGFGSKLVMSGIIDTIYTNIYSIVIGKCYNVSDLGYYTRAKQFAELPSSTLTGIFQRVNFPLLCQIQDDVKRLENVYRRMLRVSAFVIFPLMVGLAAVAKPLILVLLKEEWLFAAVLLQIICFSYMWYPIHSINLNLLQVKGRSDLFLKLEIIKKCVGVAVLCVTIPMGLIAMCIGGVFSSLLCLYINTYYTGKLIQVGFFTQMRDLMPTFCLSIFMGIVVYATLSLLNVVPILQLIIGVLEGIILYIALAKICRFSEFVELSNIIQRK